MKLNVTTIIRDSLFYLVCALFLLLALLEGYGAFKGYPGLVEKSHSFLFIFLALLGAITTFPIFFRKLKIRFKTTIRIGITIFLLIYMLTFPFLEIENNQDIVKVTNTKNIDLDKLSSDSAKINNQDYLSLKKDESFDSTVDNKLNKEIYTRLKEQYDASISSRLNKPMDINELKQYYKKYYDKGAVIILHYPQFQRTEKASIPELLETIKKQDIITKAEYLDFDIESIAYTNEKIILKYKLLGIDNINMLDEASNSRTQMRAHYLSNCTDHLIDKKTYFKILRNECTTYFKD